MCGMRIAVTAHPIWLTGAALLCLRVVQISRQVTRCCWCRRLCRRAATVASNVMLRCPLPLIMLLLLLASTLPLRGRLLSAIDHLLLLQLRHMQRRPRLRCIIGASLWLLLQS